jgi:hypothetical protein
VGNGNPKPNGYVRRKQDLLRCSYALRSQRVLLRLLCSMLGAMVGRDDASDLVKVVFFYSEHSSSQGNTKYEKRKTNVTAEVGIPCGGLRHLHEWYRHEVGIRA